VQAVCRDRPLTLSLDGMFSLAGEVEGLSLGLDTCGAVLAGDEPAAAANAYGITHLIVSAPRTDLLGQVYNAYAPIAGSDSASMLRELATAGDAVYFSAAYDDWNQIYADYKAIF